MLYGVLDVTETITAQTAETSRCYVMSRNDCDPTDCVMSFNWWQGCLCLFSTCSGQSRPLPPRTNRLIYLWNARGASICKLVLSVLGKPLRYEGVTRPRGPCRDGWRSTTLPCFTRTTYNLPVFAEMQSVTERLWQIFGVIPHTKTRKSPYQKSVRKQSNCCWLEVIRQS
jgi:hypothetical protein